MKVGKYVQLKCADGRNRLRTAVIASLRFVVVMFDTEDREKRSTQVLEAGKAKDT